MSKLFLQVLKETDPSEGLLGASKLEQVRQKHRWKAGLKIGIEVGWGQGAVLWTEPLNCVIWPYLQVNRVRIEFNCRTASWSVGQPTMLGGVGKNICISELHAKS